MSWGEKAMAVEEATARAAEAVRRMEAVAASMEASARRMEKICKLWEAGAVPQLTRDLAALPAFREAMQAAMAPSVELKIAEEEQAAKLARVQLLCDTACSIAPHLAAMLAQPGGAEAVAGLASKVAEGVT